MDDLRDRLIAAHEAQSTAFARLIAKIGTGAQRPLEKGVYLWGSVGRGKTWLMDIFYQSLPFPERRRRHFHRFMADVHAQLRDLKDQEAPLDLVAQSIAAECRVLCFDEFFVSDIADAMILARLLEGLFDHGVTLVATSNTRPAELYKDGLQRQQFLPAIKLIKQHTDVWEMEAAPTTACAGSRRQGLMSTPAPRTPLSASRRSSRNWRTARKSPLHPEPSRSKDVRYR